MNDDLYLGMTQSALTAVNGAMLNAQRLLPPEIVGKCPTASRRSPAAWRKVEFWYGTQADREQWVWDILVDLRLLAEAAACLTTVVRSRERAEVEPDLRLAKQKGAA